MLVTMGTHGTNELFLKKKSIKNKTNSFFYPVVECFITLHHVCPKNCGTNINYIPYIFFLSTTVSMEAFHNWAKLKLFAETICKIRIFREGHKNLKNKVFFWLSSLYAAL